ncbi:carboxyltransferase subunit of acetyl-CoA carboxylase [Mycolicibacterium phlei]|jgi:acetyl-CoA carboxylase carboxyl transferase beta subunit|uniref:Acetyl-CoA carboxylase carboxyl transferase subunit beta n=1 Tax=Mycolicibacterium phlei DSM 43239 = CCUG 21000 TaxID=1226750 RepID=A0A5N5UV28_MYCPH|nr:carboxyl transferase domain-containing protein [Mycolicibacterium phlei]VEG07789.1 carboxyltransferase subunit of acetyl-CoA carboxylase [Mycobacteroides chelonae]AMO59660.1 Acetyl-coenzyme A carboxylase carboxyl transferase subunit beta [Mycolicibacterium phlei]EID10704.1 acetyl-coenzyme a carboxylase carboxyl transferase [Mycolicibacterium phlei RIVM601174]KAB7753484.1 acetyl-CoA carboxylase carboxyl transferase subunit beta [Mycolicibacterium phlei DSM 43239 = CCUG 21000]KXW62387.1 acety
MSRTGALEVRDAVLDEGSFRSWDGPPLRFAVSDGYRRELAEAQARTGLDESVVTGEGTVFGRRVAVVLCEFDFLAGSIGVAAAERITAAVRRATAERLPLLASPSSGGTRMQEGTVAFLQMVKIAAAVELHKRAHLPYLVYLRHPTTGGVFASWGSLGHVTAAEPGALVGFLGPRVYEHLYGEPFPEGIQTAENLLRHGVIDGVVPLSALRTTLDRALRVVADAPGPAPAAAELGPVPDVPAWDSVSASRRPDRPGVGYLLRHGATDRLLLSGTGIGEAATTLLALARFGGQPAVVLGQQRRVGGKVGPAALREARRGMALAESLQLPLVLVIDTAGPALSVEAEQGGLAGEIARCLAQLVTLDTPTVSVLLGQGSGGPALAMVPADRVLAALHGWLAPLPPEGASAIVYRDVDHAPELAVAQGIRSADLQRDGIVDVVVPEYPDAADEPLQFTERLASVIAGELYALRSVPAEARRSARLERYARIGLR